MLEFIIKVLIPIIFGAVAFSLIGVTKRYAFKKTKLSPLQFLILAYGNSTLLFAVIYLTMWGFTLPNVLPGFWQAVIGATFANFIIQWCNTKASSLDQGEVSLTAPLQAMTPGLITGLAVLLGEYPGKIGVAGIFLMICGSYVLLWTKTPEHWYGYFGPLSKLMLLLHWKKLTQAERGKAKVMALGLTSATFGTVGLLFDGLYTRRGQDTQGLVLASMTLVGILSICYGVWYALRPDNKSEQKLGRLLKTGIIKYSASFAGLWVLHVLLIQPTYNETFVAYTGTLKRFSIVGSVLLGYWLFREQDFKKRLWAATLIVAGAILVSMDGVIGNVRDKVQLLGF